MPALCVRSSSASRHCAGPRRGLAAAGHRFHADGAARPRRSVPLNRAAVVTPCHAGIRAGDAIAAASGDGSRSWGGHGRRSGKKMGGRHSQSRPRRSQLQCALRHTGLPVRAAPSTPPTSLPSTPNSPSQARGLLHGVKARPHRQRRQLRRAGVARRARHQLVRLLLLRRHRTGGRPLPGQAGVRAHRPGRAYAAPPRSRAQPSS